MRQGKSQPTPYEKPIVFDKSKNDQFMKDFFNHMGAGFSQVAKSKQSINWID